MTREIELSQGKIAVVDADDYEWLSKLSWRYNLQGYAVSQTPRLNGKRKTLMMHRLIMKTPDGMDTDHINREKLDNRKSNLRIATHSENLANSCLRSDNTSGYKGVRWEKRRNKWRSRIVKNGKEYHIGYFDNILDAVEARREEAIKLFGAFSRA